QTSDVPPKGYHMKDYFKPLGGWRTFNEFFARHIDAKARPIYKPDDSTAIVSPADSTFLGSWDVHPINDTTQFVTPKGVPWSISELLQDTVYGERFKGGKFMHAFLSTTDYHRQHAPVSGTLVEAKVIPGICYLEVVAQDQDANASMDAPDTPGYQFLQARGLIVIENDDIGLVAVMPIGMAQVSSVVLSTHLKVGDPVKKGDEISHFQFGGSDIIMVFEAKANVDFSKTEKIWHGVGQLLATANPQKN
ncbi:hypothetical protein M422DRAFT_171232, partial [Sphaerobolus stellatus SS14]